MSTRLLWERARVGRGKPSEGLITGRGAPWAEQCLLAGAATGATAWGATCPRRTHKVATGAGALVSTRSLWERVRVGHGKLSEGRRAGKEVRTCREDGPGAPTAVVGCVPPVVVGPTRWSAAGAGALVSTRLLWERARVGHGKLSEGLITGRGAPWAEQCRLAGATAGATAWGATCPRRTHKVATGAGALVSTRLL